MPGISNINDSPRMILVYKGAISLVSLEVKRFRYMDNRSPIYNAREDCIKGRAIGKFNPASIP